MSWLDTIGKTIMPLASAETRAEARRNAETIARDNEWLSQILDAHREIERYMGEALSAPDAQSRIAASEKFFHLLASHSIAEEVAIYPALVDHNGAVAGKIHAAMAYEEQQVAKIQQAKLKTLDPMGSEWRNKMEHLQAAIQQHVYQEESSWFPELAKNAAPEKRQMLSREYAEAFDRYGGKNLGSAAGRAVAGGSSTTGMAGSRPAGMEPADVPPVPGIVS
ncbi:hemerythrin domain-containing protein [Altericroceibacterium xinjiangense]|uniref:hemerythrin domain-containing protein n=1 Tax=Altericroceibacterium xinjiangense TaxID=762261 RepID=UPI000F7D5F87|nr:hemerythrin domain-containing protein [Altericroceibacterium xinjiangense]